MKQELTLHPCTQPAIPLSPERRHTLPFVFLFPPSANLPPSMTFPQGLGSVEYAIHVVLKGKKKFGGAKKWMSTLVLKVEISRRAIGARLETMAIADATMSKTNHVIMVQFSKKIADHSLNTLVSFSLDIRIIILHCISLRVYCKSLRLKQL